MGYVPLNNYNYDSGYRRIQSGPNHQGFIVLTSGSSAYGVNEGIVVPGSPLSGSPAGGTWDYDSNWRYVPPTLPNQSGSVDPTPYNASDALDTYNAARIYTRDNVAGAQAASAIGPETGKVNPRGGALQPRANVTRPEKYMYFGGGAPDNQDYSPYNTPDANTAAEGKTGGGVTHRNYESSLLTNLLGSQGTSDRSQWRYHQPVYCKTFTETQRSATPGLMSSPLRYIYRGSATSYNYNYGGELLANKGGFELLPYDDQTFGCPFPVGCPTNSGEPDQVLVGDVLSAVVYCNFVKIEWFNTSSSVVIGTGTDYTVQTSDISFNIYYVVTYFDGSTDTSSLNCFPPVSAVSLRFWFQTVFSLTPTPPDYVYSSVVDSFGDMYFSVPGGLSVFTYTSIYKISNSVSEIWKVAYPQDPSLSTYITNRYGESFYALDSGEDSLDFINWQWSTGPGSTNWPVRIYRYRISKSTGAIQDIAAVDFNPAAPATSVVFYITTVLLDSDNNYYFVGYFPNSISNSSGASVVKLSENLTFLWCRDINSILYRTTGDPNFCGLGLSAGYVTLNIDKNDEIIGCAWSNSVTGACLNYFCIQLDGTVTDRFKSKFKTSLFNSDTDPFKVRAICKDIDGSVYGVGSYGTVSQVGSGSDIIVFKDSADDTTVWATNIKNTFFIPLTRVSLNVLQNQLIIINSKLVLVAPWSLVGTPTTYTILIFVFDLNTGVIEKAVNIKAPTDTGSRLIVQRLYEKNKILVSTNTGYRIRLDLSDLPAAGDYICVDDVTKKYTASGLVPAQSDVVFYKFNSCGPDSAGAIITRDLSSNFSSASFSPTTSGVQGNIFRYFAGQDTP